MSTRPASGRARRRRALAPVLVSMILVGTAALVPDPGPSGVAAAAPVPGCTAPAPPPGVLGVVPQHGAGTTTCGATRSSGLRPAAVGAAGAYNGGSPPLVYHGGPVVGTASTLGENTVHLLLWTPPGYAFPSGYTAELSTYVADVAADSGRPTNVYATDTQYTQGASHIHYLVHDGGSLTVTDAFPTSGTCAPDTAHGEGYTVCLPDSALQAEVGAVVNADGLPSGLGQIYVVVLPPKVETCFGLADAAAGGTCSDTHFGGFCAYHSGTYTPGGELLYVNLTFPTAYLYSCLPGQAPNGLPSADAAVGLLSHEQNETITDPLGSAWSDPSGNEDGDECAWTFGTALGGPSGAEWNQVIDGHKYWIQQEFSNEDYAANAAGGCVSGEELPTAAFAVSTPTPQSGSPTAFDGSSSVDPDQVYGITAWSWSFGDGTPAGTWVTPTHVFAAPGTYTVTLTVTDVDGWTASVSHPVTVVGPPAAPAFTAASPPGSATAGGPYAYTFAAIGHPVPTYALVGAPPWLAISPATGAVSGVPPAGTASFAYTVTATNGVSPDAVAGPFAVAVSAPAGAPPQHGYWLVGADGGIFTFGSAAFYGSTGGLRLQRPVVGITPSADRRGYWLVASDGGIFAFGDSGFFGSLPGLGFRPAGTPGSGPDLQAPVVAVVPSFDGGGYFMVASDGGVFAFGDARFAGSCPSIGGCSGPAVAVLPDATGDGYWLVTATGGVYAFGDAPALGAPGPRAAPVTSAVRTPDGGGYWILFADGSVAAFGDAVSLGSPSGTLGGSDPATAVFATSDGNGYWVATALGGVLGYGDAPNDGDMAGARLNAPIIAAVGW